MAHSSRDKPPLSNDNDPSAVPESPFDDATMPKDSNHQSSRSSSPSINYKASNDSIAIDNCDLDDEEVEELFKTNGHHAVNSFEDVELESSTPGRRRWNPFPKKHFPFWLESLMGSGKSRNSSFPYHHLERTFREEDRLKRRSTRVRKFTCWCFSLTFLLFTIL
jgi:hypothetical protein